MNPADIAKEVGRLATTHGLSKDVIDLLEKKLDLLTEDFAALTEENATLKTENMNLRYKLAQLEKQNNDTAGRPDGFDETTEKIVLRLFGNSDVTREAVARELGLEFGIVEYHFDLLDESGLAGRTKIGIHTHAGYSPPGFSLTPKGRAYAVKLKS